MLDDNERDELESAGFTIKNASPESAAAMVEYEGSERQLKEALPIGWRARGVEGFMSDPTIAALERVKR